MTGEKQKIYLETSVISAYFDFKKQAPERKTETQIFFKEELKLYKAFISDAVLEELTNTPSPDNQEKLLKFVNKIPVLQLDKKSIQLANEYIGDKIIPAAKLFDAYHLALATLNNIDILLSWNYSHIANLEVEKRTNAFNILKGLPEIKIEFPGKLLTAQNYA